MPSKDTSSETQHLFNAGDRVGVLLPRPLAGAYDYAVPEGMTLRTGDVVSVPLGRSTSTGVVMGIGEGSFNIAKLKPLKARLDTPPLPIGSIDFIKWVAAYTLSPPGSVLKMVISVPDALEPAKPITAYVINPASPSNTRITATRQRVLDVTQDGVPRLGADLAREAATSPSVIKGMVVAGYLKTLSVQTPRPAPPDHAKVGPVLSDEQGEAAKHLCQAVNDHAFGVHVLDGVTGSGKTEVYFEAVAAALAAGRQALVMLPEIALGAQWRKRFLARFGALPLEWHSDLTPARRRDTWRQIAAGGPAVVVGARSALFLPYPDLGLIVADEEHDAAYKQEEGVIYNARDMAVVRGRIGSLPVVLASATPSLETVVNARQSRFEILPLKERHGGAVLPQIDTLDMRKEGLPATRWISDTLIEALTATIEKGEQAMLYLNRRGYAPLTLCRGCGHRLQCPNCTAWMVEHRAKGRLQCHHCGHGMRTPNICPECEAEDKFAACGPGVERLAEELESIFPDIRYILATSDSLNSPHAAEAMIKSIENHDIDVIIGTQIVAKGYHFPLLTLVGVVDADLGLSGGDLRAAERTYQLLYQVAGRAGRVAEKPGRVLLQTYIPEHPVMEALGAGNREEFLDQEIHAREVAQMPPFGRLAALIVSGVDESRVDSIANRLSHTAPRGDGIMVFGPAPAPIAMLRGRHRRRLLLKTRKDIAPQALLKKWMSFVDVPKNVKVQLDIDPYSFL